MFDINLPNPQKLPNELQLLYKGINACDSQYDGVSVDKLIQAVAFYFDITYGKGNW